MLLTTLGSEYWPKTAEGRILTFLMSVYAFAIFGYITATIASYFIGRVPEVNTSDIGTQATPATDMIALRDEIRWLRDEVIALSSKLDAPSAHQLSGDDSNRHS
jgi:voltage-gated potassium channel